MHVPIIPIVTIDHLSPLHIAIGSHSTDTTSETNEFGAPYSSEIDEIYADHATESTLDQAPNKLEEDFPSGSVSAMRRHKSLSLLRGGHMPDHASARDMSPWSCGRSPSRARHTPDPASACDMSLIQARSALPACARAERPAPRHHC
jgi:hypothetical protein